MKKHNNSSGFDDIYMEYHALVYSICMSVTRDAEQSRDISQEVFIKLLQWIDRMEDREKIKGWLCVTARNMSVSYLRKMRRIYPEREEADGNDPEDRYIKKERRAIIEDAMSRLDDKYAEVLSMKYMLGFSTKEIAAAAGCTSATVYTRLRRGEAALKKILKEAEL